MSVPETDHGSQLQGANKLDNLIGPLAQFGRAGSSSPEGAQRRALEIVSVFSAPVLAATSDVLSILRSQEQAKETVK